MLFVYHTKIKCPLKLHIFEFEYMHMYSEVVLFFYMFTAKQLIGNLLMVLSHLMQNGHVLVLLLMLLLTSLFHLHLS